MNWGNGPKKSLSPEDVVRIAFAHLLCDVHQHTLASMWGMDSGRVAEAIVAMRWAAEHHKELYRHIQRQKKRTKNGKEPEPGTVSYLDDEQMKLLGVN